MWWVASVPPEPNGPGVVPDAAGPREAGGVDVPDEQQAPAGAPVTLPEQAVSPEGNDSGSVQIAASRTALAPKHGETGGVRLLPRAVPADDDELDEPVSLIDRLRALNAGTAAALFCGSVALLFVSIPELEFLIKPLSGFGLLVGLLAGVLPALRVRETVALPLGLSMLCLLILLFLGSWPSSSTPPPPPMAAVPLQQKGMASNQPVGADDWVDAATNAVRKDDVRVEVVSAQVGRVDLKGRSETSRSPDKYLVIRLRVSYEGIVFQQTPYDPWADRAGLSQQAPAGFDGQFGPSLRSTNL